MRISPQVGFVLAAAVLFGFTGFAQAQTSTAAVDLSLTNMVDNLTPPEGGTVQYTVVLANEGVESATGIQVDHLLPEGVTYVSSSPSRGYYVRETGVWALASLPAGATETLTVTGRVEGDTRGATLVDTARIASFDQRDPNPGNDIARREIRVRRAEGAEIQALEEFGDQGTTLAGNADLGIAKTVDNPSPAESGAIQYSVVLTNGGPDTATNIQINDLLPSGVTFSSYSATSGVYISGSGIWVLGPLTNGSSATLTINATVNTGTAGSTITNTATVAALDQTDGNSANNTDSVDITVQGADLALVKTVNDPAPNEGDTITFTIDLTNNGPDTATGVQVNDLLPSGVTLVSSSATTGSYVGGTGNWTVGTILASTTETLTINATVNAGTNGTTIVNTATITATNQLDGVPGNNSDTASITVQRVDVAVTKTVDDNFPNEGDTVVYSVVASNAGPDAASGLAISDVLPAGLTFVSSSATQGTYSSGTGIWSVGTVGSGAADTLDITATVNAGTNGNTIVNSASVSAVDQADNTAGNDSDSASLTVQSADLAIVKTVDDGAPSEGGTINYTVVLGNSGPDTATNVAVTDLLPAGVTFVSSAQTQGSYVSGTGVWSVASLASAASDTLVITATVDAGTGGTTIGNTASVTAVDQADPAAGNNSDSADVSVQGSDLAVTKSVNNNFPNEGGTVQYTVGVTNDGPDGTTNVQISDALPAGMTFVSSSATVGSYSSGTGIWSIPTLNNGASGTLTITASVNAGTGGTTIINTATATGSDQPDNNAANDSASASLTVQSVDLAVTKTIDVPQPNEGSTIQYTVVVANNGPDNASSVQVTDLLPAGLSFVSSSATQGTYVSGTGVWNVGSVANGGSDTLVITATVNAGTNGSTIVNTAAVTGSDQADGTPANDSDSASLTVQSVDLAITKSVNNSFPNEGAAVAYTVVLSNNGPDSATNIQVSDLLPAGLTFVTSNSSGGSYSSGTGIWSLANLANADADTLILVGTVNAGAGGSTIVNTASVAAVDQADSSPANDSDSASLTVQSIDLQVTKTVDDPAPTENGTITYTVVLANNGPDTATTVQVDDVLPAGVTHVSSSATQGIYIAGTGNWSVGSLGNGASATLTITATVNSGTGGTTITNTASVGASDQADSNPGNDSDSAAIDVQAVDLEVVKTVDDGFPNEGGTIVYTIALSNNGPDTATNVALTDLLPTGVTYVSDTATLGTYVPGTGVWTVGTIANAGSETLTITAMVDAGTGGTTITNTASVSAVDQADLNPGNDSDAAGLTVQSIDLAVVKTVDDAFPNEGATVTYTIALANSGITTATNVELTDVLPVGVTYVSSSVTTGSYTSGTGVWAVGSIANGAADTLSVVATVDAGTNGQTIVNTATVTASDQADDNPGNDSDSASLTVQSIDLAVVKSVDVPSPNEGSTINYEIVLTNNGPDTASSVELTDVLPAGVTFVSSVATQGSYSSGTGLWTVGSVANAASDTLVITATVDAGTGGSSIVNTASVTGSDQADSNLGNDSDTAGITVQSVDLFVTKSVDDGTPNEGGTIQYTVVLGNSGPNNATNVQVTDVLPAGVTFVSSSATQGIYSSGTGIWSVGSVANGSSKTLTITATVNAGTNGTTIVNSAAVTASDQADSNAGNDGDSAGITVQSVDVAVTKTVDDASPSEGGTINYSVVVANAGPDAATNVAVTDVLPAGVTFVSSAATQGAYVSGTGVWSVAGLASGAADTLTITATVDAGTGGTTIGNTATLTGSDQADGNAANDSDSADISVQAADLALVKSVDDAAPNEGGTINYSIVVTNNGPDATTNVAVTDVLPAGVTFVSSAATQGTYVSGTGIWSLAGLAPAASDTLTITATVDAGTNGTTIVNGASITASDQPDNNPADNSDSASLTVQSVDLQIVKSVNNPTPNEGGGVNYSVVLTNNGPNAATAIQVTDVLPAGVTYVSSSATSGSYVSGTGIWSVATLANGGSATLTITATVNAGTNGQTIVNTAAVTASDQADSNPANDSDTADITVQSVDLAVTKSVNNPTPNEGGSITYTVGLTNNGPNTATTVKVTDMLPAGVTYVSSSATAGTYSSGTGIWSVPSVANGATVTLTITATVNAGTGGTTIVNIANLSSSDQADSNPGNNSDTADIIVKSVDLLVTKTVDVPAPLEGGTINYTVVLTNNGPDAANNIQVTDNLPAGVTFVSSSATQGFYTSGTGIWVVASLANGASETLTITATVNVGTGGTTIVNTATVTASDEADGNAANDSDTASISVQEADLALTKSVNDASPAEGGTVVYTVGLTNNGPDGATNVQVTDVLPAGMTYVSSSATIGSYVSGTGLWSLASLGNGASATLTITATVNAGTGGTTIVNTASVTASDLPDNNPADNSDSATLTVDGADLAVAKTVDNPTPAEGGTITYTVVLTNNGPDGATNIQVNELVPAGVTYVSSSLSQGFYISGTGVWILASQASATSDTLTIVATVNAGTDGQTITNTASIGASDQNDGNTANNSASADIVVTGGADLSIVKTVDDAGPAEGATITYSVVLANGGPDPAGGVEVTDVLPAGVTYVSSAATTGSYDDGTGVWTVGAIAVAASDTLTITATVDIGTGGQTITNTASVTASTETDGNAANDSDSADINVQSSADLAVVKTVDDPAPDEGGTVVYTIALTNNGPNPTTNVDVTDLLPAGVTYVSDATTQGSYVSGTGVWSVPSLAVSASDTLTITATVDAGTAGTTITNTATVTASDLLDGNAANDSDSADLTVAAADLAVTKTVDDPAPLEGATIIYTIELANLGPDAATNVEVTDLLPAGVTYVSDATTQGTYVSGTGVWSVASMAGSTADTLTITATVDAGTGGSTITNTASVTASDQADGNAANDSDRVEPTWPSSRPWTSRPRSRTARSSTRSR